MAYSALAAANAFIRHAKEGRLAQLSPMKLQKLLFYAQSWHLGLYDEPLFDDFFARWKYGPVVPSLYHEFKEYGASPIASYGGYYNDRDARIECPTIPDDDARAHALIQRIIEVYGRFSGAQLSELTHRPGTAWSETGPADGGVIGNDALKHHIRPAT